MFWLLLGALVVLSLVALGLTVLVLWRRVKDLGRSVGEVGTAAAQASAALDSLKRPQRAAPPCPTCGAPASAAVRPVRA